MEPSWFVLKRPFSRNRTRVCDGLFHVCLGLTVTSCGLRALGGQLWAQMALEPRGVCVRPDPR